MAEKNLGAAPSATTDDVTKGYVDGLIAALGTPYSAGGTDVAVADGGTGRSTSTTAYGVLAAGTTATGVHQTISPGTTGQVLKSAGAAALPAFANLMQSDPQWIIAGVKTSNYSAAVNEIVAVDATSGAVQVTLPTAPAAGSQVFVKANNATNAATVVTGGSDTWNISGGATSQTLYFTNYGILATYYSGIWYQTSIVMPVGQLDSRYLRADSTAQSLSGKTIDLASNTLTTTLAQLNTAVSNAELVQGSVNGTGTSLILWTGTAAQYAALGAGRPSTTVYIVTP